MKDLGLLILRAGAGLMMMGHGWGKVADLFTGRHEFPDPIGIGSGASLALAAFAEFLCSLAVVVGFRARLAAIPVLITMLVAALIFHAGDPWAKKELAVLFAVAFAAIALLGAGRFSVDSMLGKRPSR